MSRARRDIIFIDRDGVINKDPGGWTEHNYVTDIKDLHFIPGSLEALKMLNRSGIGVVVVSNQAGVSRGYFSKEALDKVNSRMLDEIGKYGGRIEAVYYCLHKDADNCNCRKPKTGLFDLAARRHNIDTKATYVIGDSYVDITAGHSIGAKTIFVLSGKLSLDDLKKHGARPDYIFKDLLEAVKWLIAKQRRKSARAVKRDNEERKR